LAPQLLALPPKKTSEILVALIQRDSERLSVAEIVYTLGPQAFALLVFVLGLPNCLPMPPPIPFLCGLLLAVVAIQMMIGLEVPWLPGRLLRRSVLRADVKRAVDKALPRLRTLERLSRARLTLFGSSIGMRIIGAIVFVIALGLLVAAPLIGQIPLGLAACLVGLGLVERDGAIVLGGVLLGIIGIGLSLGFVAAIVGGVLALFF
jgi:hypothetical protein